MHPSSDTVDRFLEQASAQPAAPAVVGQGGAVSYEALEQRVRAFAAQFARVEQPRVLVALEPSADAYACILATGLAGGFHTPLNLAAPPSKLRRIAASLEPTVVVGRADALAAVAGAAPGALVLDSERLPDERLDGRGSRHEIAYVIFTSGSTGAPKGVVVGRHALDHYVGWLATLRICAGDRVSQQPNLGFDISMTDIFGALAYGGALYPLDGAGDRLTPGRFIARHAITVWNSTPSAISLMMRGRQMTAGNLASVRLFNFCGEPLLKEHLDAIFQARPDARVQNTYGPTEATISMTALELTSENYEDACRSSVAIGDAIAGMAYELVGGTHPDEGEIVISGPQLADGYWRDAAATVAAFRPVELGDGARRGYFTGDWAERHGHVYFKERIDFQVKVRGHRVELDEVAHAIRACGWATACVFKRGEALAALVEEADGRSFDEPALKEALRDHLEGHAIPAQIRSTAQLPRTENDKIDRKAAAAAFEQAL